MDDSLQFAEPLAYYLISGVALATFVALAVVPFRNVSRGGALEVAFILSICAALLACRWPIFFLPHQMNPDEGGFIAAAMKARMDFVPWRGFDTSTSGPFNTYILLLPTLFGAEIGFFSARITGLCLLAGAIVALYFTVKWVYGESVARLSVVAPVSLLAITKHSELVHYSSEQLSIFLTTVSLAAAAYLVRGTGSKSSRLIACVTAGLCIGSAGFAKLQALPIGLAVFVALVVAIILTPRRASTERGGYSAEVSVDKGMEIFLAFAALLAVPVAMIIALSATGVLADAMISYYEMAFVYVEAKAPVGIGFFLSTARKYAGEYPVFLICSLTIILIGGVAALFSRIHFSRILLWALSCSGLLFLFSFFVVYQAHRPFAHYLLFTIVPVSFCVAGALELLRQRYLPLERRGLVRGLFVALFLIPIGFTAAKSPRKAKPEVSAFIRMKTEAVARHVKPGDRMLVWGWNAEYYVKTKTIVSTPDLNIERLVEPSPYREYFRERFMSELRAHPPQVVVDDVAPKSFVYSDRATHGIESFPILDAFVRENYTQQEEVGGVRIFVAKNQVTQ